MKKLFVNFLFLVLISTPIFSQTSKIPISHFFKKNDIALGVGSIISEGRIQDMALTPQLGWQLSEKIQTGAYIIYTHSKSNEIDVKQDFIQFYGKYFPYVLKHNVKPFVQGSIGKSFTDNSYILSTSVGITGFLSKWFYVEGLIRFRYIKSGETSFTAVQTGIGIGIKI